LTFDLDALFTELAAKQPEGAPNVWTTTELMDKLGVGLAATKKRVKLAIDAGKAKPTWKRVPDMHGALRRVQAYEFGEWQG